MIVLKEEAIMNSCLKIKWNIAPWNTSGQKFSEKIGASEKNDWLSYEWNKKN